MKFRYPRLGTSSRGAALKMLLSTISLPSYDPAMLDHLSIQCADLRSSSAFYDGVLAPLGGTRAMDFGDVIGYGVGGRPIFWLGPLTTGDDNREIHVAFEAPDRESVRAFFEVAVGLGAEVLNEPRGLAGVSRALLRRLRPRPGRQQRRSGLPSP